MYGPMRIGGLASGMDIDQIVHDLMKAERMQVDKLYQQKQVMEWQKADYREINLKLRSLYNASFDMRLTSSYMKYKATCAMNDGTDYGKFLSLTPGAGAFAGNYDVEVAQLADYAKLESSTSFTKPLMSSDLSTLDLENDEIIISAGSKFYVAIDGVEKLVTLDEGSYDVNNESDLARLANDLENAINTAFGWEGDGGGNTLSGVKRVQVGVHDNRLSIRPQDNFNKVPIKFTSVKDSEGEITDKVLSKLGIDEGASYHPLRLNSELKSQLLGDIGDGVISFSINGHEFEFGSKSSLQLIMGKINSTTDLDVVARYDVLTDKFALISKETGLGAKIDISDESGLFKALGFDVSETITAADEITYSASASGQNARIVLNGTIVEKTTNEFNVNNIRFNLKETMEAGQMASFRIENDLDAAVDSIKEYVELYNEVIEHINGKLSEEKFRKYPPLTEEQKKDMSENEIKLWEEKAKSGHLRSDPLLERIIRELRFDVSNPVANLPRGMNSLSAIGITTGDWMEKGKLHINEEQLRAALAKDSQGVMEIFNKSGEDASSKGVANRLYDILKNGLSDITEKAGGGEFQLYDDSSLGKQIRDMEDRIFNFEETLLRTEDRYWQQFIRMEQAIQYANEQSMWLASQLNMYMGGF